MLQPPPAEPGMMEEEVDTPALILDLDAFEANLDAMAALLAPTGAKLRAHAKTHKSAVIARLLNVRGAVGQFVEEGGADGKRTRLDPSHANNPRAASCLKNKTCASTFQ